MARKKLALVSRAWIVNESKCRHCGGIVMPGSIVFAVNEHPDPKVCCSTICLARFLLHNYDYKN